MNKMINYAILYLRGSDFMKSIISDFAAFLDGYGTTLDMSGDYFDYPICDNAQTAAAADMAALANDWQAVGNAISEAMGI